MVITLNIAGYAQCRLATDPDPTDERRGVSGYTFALPGEPDLDWTIYTQPGAGVVPRIGAEDRAVGVQVTGGFLGTTPIEPGHPLYQAAVTLENGPRFEERNYVVTTQSFGVISPFHMRIKGKGIEVFRQVDFYLGKPLNTPVTEIPQSVLAPYTLQGFDSNVGACAALLGDSQNPSVYRKQRLDRLLQVMATARLTPDAKAALDKRIAQLRMDDPRDRRTAQLVNRANFSYALNGPASLRLDKQPAQWLNGLQTRKGWAYHQPSKPLSPWPFNFWLGSWDADSLTFYLSGTLEVYDLGPLLDEWATGKTAVQPRAKATPAKPKASATR